MRNKNGNQKTKSKKTIKGRENSFVCIRRHWLPLPAFIYLGDGFLNSSVLTYNPCGQKTPFSLPSPIFYGGSL